MSFTVQVDADTDADMPIDVHLFPNAPEGHALLHQLQQRAEAWAEGNICTMIFSTDDFWCLDMMKKNSSRMRVLSVYDLSASESIRALRLLRRSVLKKRHPALPIEETKVENDRILRGVFDLVGGRMSHLSRVVRADNLLGEPWLVPRDDFLRGSRGHG